MKLRFSFLLISMLFSNLLLMATNGHEDYKYSPAVFFFSLVIIALLLVAYIGTYVLVAKMARRRNRKQLIWILSSLILTPFLTAILLLAIGKNEIDYLCHHKPILPMTIKIETEEALPQAARQLLEAAGEKRLWAFYATMGAGKTTLIAALCRELGVEADMVASPTFSIINEYVAQNGNRVYHFDFYRVESIEEAMDTGAEDYFDSGHYCFIEWPQNASSLINSDAFNVNIDVDPETGARIVTTL